LELRTPTAPMPKARAFSTARSMALMDGAWPKPPPPSITAVAPKSRTTRMSGCVTTMPDRMNSS
jgi:hypothetical protein